MSDLVKDLTQYRISGIEKAEVEYYQSLTRTTTSRSILSSVFINCS